MKFVDSQKYVYPTPVVYATDRSKAMIPVLFLFCVATGRFMFLSLFVLVFLHRRQEPDFLPW